MAKTLVVTETGLMELGKGSLSKIEAQVLWSLASNLPPSGDVVTYADIVRMLSISIMSAKSSIAKLTRQGFLIRGVKTGLSYHYKLNPAFFRIIS